MKQQHSAELTRLLASVREPGADAWVFLGIADELGEEDHPAAQELALLARDVVQAESWAVSMLASAVFLTVLEREGL